MRAAVELFHYIICLAAFTVGGVRSALPPLLDLRLIPNLQKAAAEGVEL